MARKYYTADERGVPKRMQYNTLRWCNKIRKADGKAPLVHLPKGVPGDGGSCPCGRATGWFVDGDGEAFRRRRGDLEYVDLPMSVQEFVTQFDRGKY